MSAARTRTSLACAGLLLVLGTTVAIGDRESASAVTSVAVVASWVAFGLAAWSVRGVPERAAVRLIVTGGVLLQAWGTLFTPRLSDDVYRYAWDGRVGNHGVDPYAYVPNAPQLSGLRVPWLFPQGQAPLINRPDVHTIYPPVAQLWFRLVDLLSPDALGIRGYQIAAGLVAVATTFALIAVLRRLGKDPRGAALWAWCPLVVLESGANGHVDGLGALLALLAVYWLARRRTWLGSVVLALAVGVKLLPGLVLPAVARRSPWKLLVALVGVLGIAYLPHLLGVGSGTVGFLPQYLGDEGYDDGSRFALLSLVLPHGWATAAALLVLLGTAAVVLVRSDQDDPWPWAAVMVGVSLLVVTPTYPWYALLLVPLAVVAARPSWLVVAAAGYVPYLFGFTGHTISSRAALGYGVAAAVVLGAALRRRRAGVATSDALRDIRSLAPPVAR
jgi:hypothetical protein